MELLAQTLTQWLETEQSVPIQFKYAVLLDVAYGVNFLHSKSIIHRDLTANNILLTNELVDFGVSVL